MGEKLKQALGPCCLGLVAGLLLGLLIPGGLRQLDPPPAGQLQPAVPSDLEGRIDLNTADEAALLELPVIGETLAGRILEYRERNGPFRSVWELTAVTGLGEGMAEKLAPYVYVTVSEKE